MNCVMQSRPEFCSPAGEARPCRCAQALRKACSVLCMSLCGRAFCKVSRCNVGAFISIGTCGQLRKSRILIFSSRLLTALALAPTAAVARKWITHCDAGETHKPRGCPPDRKGSHPPAGCSSHLVTSVTGRPLVTALCFELRLYENDRTQRNSASR